MKSCPQSNLIQQLALKSCKLGLLAGFLLLVAQLPAQTAVTGITYGTAVNNTDTTHGGLTFREQDSPVTSVATTLGNYQFNGPVASSVIVRRNTTEAGPNSTTVFYQNNSGNTAPLGQYESSVSNMFLSGNLYEGLRNPFANGAGAQNSNIERLDFYYAGGYTVQANDALVFFDLENTGNMGDGFRIAAFTAVDGAGDLDAGTAGTPTTYANSGLLVPADSFTGGNLNSPTGGTSGNFERATYTNGDNLSGTAGSVTNIGTGLNLVGILIRFSDLGISAGTTIQGFSLMAGDTAPVSAASLVNWNTTTYYPTNTDPTTYGNMDFMAFGATISRPVPEPSTYGAILMGLMAVGLGWRRARKAGLATS